LVSTISFSGLARMDYSLLGNNVLKDHSQPARQCLEAGPLPSLPARQVSRCHRRTRCHLQEPHQDWRRCGFPHRRTNPVARGENENRHRNGRAPGV